MDTSTLVLHYLITGRTIAGERINMIARNWGDAKTLWHHWEGRLLTATLWRVDPHHRRHRLPGYRVTRSVGAARVTVMGLVTSRGERVCEFCNRVGHGSPASMGEDTVHYCDHCRRADAAEAAKHA